MANTLYKNLALFLGDDYSLLAYALYNFVM